ncbi:uncharacterized protein LOC135689982 isoform X2 [Rhopilema esculentum]|uniref:uncharacterized protein LOC135689982 isoform X2 n=1 Tax=Rhopilema esculentum TaxID=499914 RepID=UPI0031E36DFD
MKHIKYKVFFIGSVLLFFSFAIIVMILSEWKISKGSLESDVLHEQQNPFHSVKASGQKAETTTIQNVGITTTKKSSTFLTSTAVSPIKEMTTSQTITSKDSLTSSKEPVKTTGVPTSSYSSLSTTEAQSTTIIRQQSTTTEKATVTQNAVTTKAKIPATTTQQRTTTQEKNTTPRTTETTTTTKTTTATTTTKEKTTTQAPTTTQTESTIPATTTQQRTTTQEVNTTPTTTETTTKTATTAASTTTKEKTTTKAPTTMQTVTLATTTAALSTTATTTRISTMTTAPWRQKYFGLGCYNSNGGTTVYPHLVANLRPLIDWNNMTKSVIACADHIKKPETIQYYGQEFTFFAIKFYGECWAQDTTAQTTYYSRGDASSCYEKTGGDSSVYAYHFGPADQQTKISFLLDVMLMEDQSL